MRTFPRESGNAFMMVLIGIVLFAALAFTFTRSGRQGVSNVSTQEASLIAGDVISYGQAIERGVNRMRVKGVSESDIDFVGANGAYDNASCTEDKCEVFNAGGGQQVWQPVVTKANNGDAWIFTGDVSVANLGQDDGTAKSSELIAFMPNVHSAICMEINRKLGVDNPADAPPAATGAVNFSTLYTGTFTAGDAIAGAQLNGKRAGCFAVGTVYHYYQVLLAR